MADTLRSRAAHIVSQIGGLDKPRQGRACDAIAHALAIARAEGRRQARRQHVRRERDGANGNG